MTQDPDRGCVTFAVSIDRSLLCLYDVEKLKRDLEDYKYVLNIFVILHHMYSHSRFLNKKKKVPIKGRI